MNSLNQYSKIKPKRRMHNPIPNFIHNNPDYITLKIQNDKNSFYLLEILEEVIYPIQRIHCLICKLVFLIIVFLIGQAGACFGQIVRPLHGGQLKKAGDYFIEIVKSNGKLIFYIAKQNEDKPLVKEIYGFAEIKYEELTTKENLKMEDSLYFTVPLKKEYLVKVNLYIKIDGKDYKIKLKRDDIIRAVKTDRQYKIPKTTTPSKDNHGGHSH